MCSRSTARSPKQGWPVRSRLLGVQAGAHRAWGPRGRGQAPHHASSLSQQSGVAEPGSPVLAPTEEGQDREGSSWAGRLLPGELRVSGERMVSRWAWPCSRDVLTPQGPLSPPEGAFFPGAASSLPHSSPPVEQRLLLSRLAELILAAPGTCS